MPSLMPHHTRELAEGSGLTEETISAAGIYSEADPAKLAKLLKMNEKLTKRMAPAIIFPFTRLGSAGYCRAKPDTPRNDRNGDKIKYESPRGEPNEIYWPPAVATYAHDPRQELCLTEGEKKSLCLTQTGFPCIGLVGVFGWKVSGKERLLPELESVAWTGRRVFLVFDSDVEEKEQVRDAESRLAAALMAQGAIVRCARLSHASGTEAVR